MLSGWRTPSAYTTTATEATVTGGPCALLLIISSGIRNASLTSLRGTFTCTTVLMNRHYSSGKGRYKLGLVGAFPGFDL
jgi:hypothetical protein